MARVALRDAGREDEAGDEGLVLVVVGDVSDEGNVKRMFEEVGRVYGEFEERGILRAKREDGRGRDD